MHLYNNLRKIHEYSMNHSWSSEEISVPHIIIVLSFFVVITIVNSYYDERILRKHMLYSRFRKECVAEIVSIKECVLAAGTGQQFYSIVSFNVQGEYIETKITAGKNDCIGRKVDIVYWGTGKKIAIRKQNEEMFLESFFKERGKCVKDYLKSQVIYGIIVSLLLAFALGISYLAQALIILVIMLCFFYVVYPCVFCLRMLVWKTNITWK